MKKLLSIFIVTCLLYGSGAEAMWARAGGALCKKTALVKAVAATGALGASTYAYKNRDNLQDKAVKTGLNFIQKCAPQDKKDQYVSRVFNTIKKYKPALLSSMRDYYENRFDNAIYTQQTIAPHEENALYEFAHIIAPDMTKPMAERGGGISEFRSYGFVQNNPRADSFLVDYAAKNITRLTQDGAFLLLLAGRTVKLSREYRDRLIHAIKENFKDVDSGVLSYVPDLLNKESKESHEFVDLVIQYPEKEYPLNFFGCLFEKPLAPTQDDIKKYEKLYKAAMANIEHIHISMLDNIFHKYQSVYNHVIVPSIIENINNMNAAKLEYVLRRLFRMGSDGISYGDRELILNALRDRLVKNMFLAENFSIQNFSTILQSEAGLIELYNNYSEWVYVNPPDGYVYRPSLKQTPIPLSMSQTEAHVFVHQCLIKKKFSNALRDPQVVRMINSLHEQEKKEEHAGNFTFVHGCAWDWDLKQDIFTHLMEIKLNKKFENYRFLRFKDNYNVTQVDESVHATLAQGNAEALRSDILFMNHAVFGNSSRKGSCTFDYWYHNYDQSVNNNRNLINAEELFAQVGMRDFFTRYKKDIQNLERLHKKAENKGVILLISANQEMVRQNIYPTTSGGAKVVVKTKDKKTLDSAQAIITQLKQNPTVLQNADAIEYGLLCSNKFVLNPDKAGKDIKIFPYSLAHGTPAYQEYCNARDQLMAKIKRDIYEQNHPELVQESRVRSILAMSM
ncbi:MAG: hypothetical protein WC707_00825 [Candidatus Babeliaceae bacterium]